LYQVVVTKPGTAAVDRNEKKRNIKNSPVHIRNIHNKPLLNVASMLKTNRIKSFRLHAFHGYD
jgi:hypothetical protein